MSEKATKTPQIRFDGYTDAWEQRKFEDLLDSKDGVRRGPFGSALKKEFFVEDSEYVVYEQQNAIYDNYHTRYKITKEKFDELSKFKLNPGDFIMSGAGTIGRISRVPKGVKLGVFNQALIRFKINPEITDSEYFIQFVRADFMQKKLTGANPGSAITNLVPMSEVKKWEIKVPYLEEQQKIGNFFKEIDTTITLHQRECDLLAKMKKSYLQKMFPKNGEDKPEIRFDGYTDAWEQRKLGEIGKTQSGIGFPDNEQGGLEGVPFFKVSDMNNAGNEHEMKTANNYVSEEQLKRKKWKPIETVPAVMFAKVGAAIMLNRKRIVRTPFLIDNNTMAYVFDESWDTDFGKTLFETINLPRYAQVGALPSYNGSDIESIEISIPNKDEQIKIGSFFSNLDHIITLHQRELDSLKKMKKSLLQMMFV
ncbi:restriction endonuclease subunit S [Streptococcus macedonicus]|uniref:restriction endonuclease subunit S n=4 Tax=Streptococcus macedonicus TaxID=59310 RepID=UPI002243B480|nr:restriction endonuclease subunit S [Streptococcus macedonicus]MCW8518880.1 restriction endonuclease subunit S [Streptococcus macedonicus]